MQVYNDELYHYGKLGMKWGHRKNMSTISKYGSSKPTPKKTTTKKKKSVQEHKVTGSKIVGGTLKFLGQNAMRAHTLYDADRLSKTMFPD